MLSASLTINILLGYRLYVIDLCQETRNLN